MAWAITCWPSGRVKGSVARCANLPTQVPTLVRVNAASLTSPKLRTSPRDCLPWKSTAFSGLSPLSLWGLSCHGRAYLLLRVPFSHGRQRHSSYLDNTGHQAGQAMVSSPETRMVNWRGITRQPHLLKAFLVPWWFGSMALDLEVSSRFLVIWDTGSGSHWHESSGHELKFLD